MKDIPITKETKEIWDIIDDAGIEIGKDSCLCLINPAQRALLLDMEKVGFGTIFDIRLVDGLPKEWYEPVKEKFFKGKKKIKPCDFDK